jgi:hypothetical protein
VLLRWPDGLNWLDGRGTARPWLMRRWTMRTYLGGVMARLDGGASIAAFPELTVMTSAPRDV